VNRAAGTRCQLEKHPAGLAFAKVVPNAMAAESLTRRLPAKRPAGCRSPAFDSEKPADAVSLPGTSEPVNDGYTMRAVRLSGSR
jgi:hypothetical protein